MRDGLTIGELAQRCGISRDAIRFYEREGVLPSPRRSEARYRLYAPEDEARLRFVRGAQAMGLTLAEVRQLLQAREAPGECDRVAAVLRERMTAIDHRMAELAAFRQHLAESLRECEAAASDACPVAGALAEPAAPKGRR